MFVYFYGIYYCLTDLPQLKLGLKVITSLFFIEMGSMQCRQLTKMQKTITINEKVKHIKETVRCFQSSLLRIYRTIKYTPKTNRYRNTIFIIIVNYCQVFLRWEKWLLFRLAKTSISIASSPLAFKCLFQVWLKQVNPKLSLRFGVTRPGRQHWKEQLLQPFHAAYKYKPRRIHSWGLLTV